MSMPPYLDLHDMDEAARIRLIGDQVMQEPDGFRAMVTVDDIPGKRERYIKKLTELYPSLEVVRQGIGPAQGALYFVVSKKAN